MEEELINDYTSGMGIYDVCAKYHIGKLKVKKILITNGIEIRKKGGKCKNKKYIIYDYKIEKYKIINGFEYIAKSKDGKYETKDYMNNTGCLTSYINKEYGVEIPSLYDRREYYKTTGDYWWEQWFDIIKVEKKKTKKCPYCDWETIDVNNKSGAFEIHLKKVHNISKIEYLNDFPEDGKYFELANKSLNRIFEKDKSKYVICSVCGKKLARIDSKHLKSHNLTKLKYIEKYGSNTVSVSLHDRMSIIAKLANKEIENGYESKAEQEIKSFLTSLGLSARKDRKLLHGTELDMLVKSHKIAIEYDGLYWHQESKGKDRNYHLSKTEECNKNGVSLIHIFEDEYVLHKDIVLSKLKHIFKKDMDLPRIMARKCVIREILKNDAFDFLDKYHIQGHSSSTIYIGAYYKDLLIAVMTFIKEKEGYWNLNRFASDYHYRMQGIGGKIFSYFVNKYSPLEIKSFADRRWTLNATGNLYTNLGFDLIDVLKPEYRYYNSKVDRFTRFHKFSFRKERLHKLYNLPLTMTENEMTKSLGYDKIWDCGLFKYVWRKKN